MNRIEKFKRWKRGENDPMADNPKVFISYSHQDEDYEKKVFDFANKLRTEGIDASIDLYEEAPKEGWPRWMENQIRWADFVIVLASKSYFDKCYTDVKGKGVSWEVNIVYQNLYDSNCETTKYIPAFFEDSESEYILTPLKPFTYYNVSKKDQYDKLYWRLRGVSKYQKPELGELRPLEPKEKKTSMFLSTPIDIEKWNAAGWKGMLYCLDPTRPPVLGLLFKNYTAAVKIFEEWNRRWGDAYADENLVVEYVVPPFPEKCDVYKDPERSYGNGYFVYIGPNIDAAIDRAIKRGLSPEEILLTTISRNLWVDELNGTRNRKLFTEIVGKIHDYRLIPAALIDDKKPFSQDNVVLGFEHAIKLRGFSSKTGNKLDENDVVKSVLQKAVNL